MSLEESNISQDALPPEPVIDGGGAPPEIEAPAPAEDTPPPKGTSVRELLQREFDKARLEEPPPPAPKPKSETRQKLASERPRDDQGRFQPEVAPTTAAPAPTVPAPAPTGQPATAAQPPVGTPPGGWSAEAKAVWPTLSPAVQQAVLNREQEVSDGFKSKSDELKGVQDAARYGSELAQVFAPHRAVFQANGRSDADVARQLLAWMSVLGHQDERVRTNGFGQLARSFNVNLNHLAPPQTAPGQQTQLEGQVEGQVPQQVPDRNLIQQLVQQQIQQEIEPLRYQTQQQLFAQQQQQQASVAEHLAQWSADKPHYEKVRNFMGSLIQAGQIPVLPSGKPDLDRAYDMAVYAIPEVRAEMAKAEEQKRAAEAAKAQETAKAEEARKAQEAKAAADRQAAEKKRADDEAARLATEERQKRVQQARRASPSIGSSAPTSLNGQKPGEQRRSKSVRESLLATIDELRA